MAKVYCGVGARSTPADMMSLMTRTAEALALCGWKCRTGDARGADAAFRHGVSLVDDNCLSVYKPDPRQQGYELWNKALATVDKFHPAPQFLSPTVRKLMARTAFQVLGPELETPARFVICWTPDGANGKRKKTSIETGGTGQAIRIAAAYDIEVLNLKNKAAVKRLEQFLAKTQEVA